MFGYLQPDKDELKIRDYKVYKSFYCGLCRQLGKDYGIIARLTLSYDCTLLALLSVSLKNEDCAFVNKRCVCNPLKKCCYCIGKNESMHFAGAVSVILTHYKFFDTLSDEGFFKKIAARFLLILFHGAFKRAVREYPEIDRLAQNMMSEQQKAEFDCVGIDRAAEPTANFLLGLCEYISDDEKYLPELKKFCYLIGRWIYLADACDDLEKDVKKGSFNPFVSKYNGDVQETMKYCREVLNMTTAHIIMAYDRLPCHSYKAVTDNIIYYGLYAKQKWLTEEKYMKNIEGEKNVISE